MPATAGLRSGVRVRGVQRSQRRGRGYGPLLQIRVGATLPGRSGPCPRPQRRPYNGRMNTLHRRGHAALRRGRFSAPSHVYHVTTATHDRTPFFADFGAACAVGRCLGRREVGGDAHTLAWVLMPDHAHWLIELGARDTLAQVVSRLKSASARAANPVLCRRGALWAPAYHDHALRDEEDLRAVARYLVGNPVRAGLVAQVGDYPFWNAVWL